MKKLPLSALTAFLLNSEMAFAENAGTTGLTTDPDIYLGALCAGACIGATEAVRCAVSS